MFLPIGDEPNIARTPVVTYALIVVNVAIYVFISWPLTGQAVDASDPLLGEYLRQMGVPLSISVDQLAAQMSAYDLFVFDHGFKPGAPNLFDLFVSMFLHGGWMHLLGNMLFLWIYGDNVEHRLGGIPYLVLYLFTGMVATAFFAMFRLDSMIPLVGASGAISGILGVYFLWFPNNQVKILVVFFLITVIRIRARWVLGFYLVVENLLPFLTAGDGGGVAHGAHLGGFLAGLGSAWAIDNWSVAGNLVARIRKLDNYLPNTMHAPAPAFSPGGGKRVDFKQRNSSREFSFEAGHKTVEPPPSTTNPLERADHLAEAGRVKDALGILQRYIATNPEENLLARAHLRLGLMLLYDMDKATAAYQHFLTVLDLDSSPELSKAARKGIEEVDRRRGVTYH